MNTKGECRSVSWDQLVLAQTMQKVPTELRKSVFGSFGSDGDPCNNTWGGLKVKKWDSQMQAVKNLKGEKQKGKKSILQNRYRCSYTCMYTTYELCRQLASSWIFHINCIS